ncbi:GCN5-related N-acetyltransferase [Rhodovulum sp. PH10]|uniref:GNAT family N-acetyltransferase n=1 Tax=Rhodovulum sp. PH10 TaxID=1187851 RepID=UPI00027C1DD7|nr:GNAT family N-acetyltransferase [Rhodovulum sp. PH10]EJW12914.1 GCN5-related N-acetyltransferase [Rhodovulum sp. PH10]
MSDTTDPQQPQQPQPDGTGPAPAKHRAVTVRPYRPADEEAVIELWRRTWQTAYPRFDFAERLPWWRERWRRELLPIASVVVAEADGEPVGFVTIDDTGYLDQIVVAPEAWGSTAATALLEEAKRVSPTGIALHVNKDNHRAIRFYERQGFSIDGEDVNAHSQSPVFLMRWRP